MTSLATQEPQRKHRKCETCGDYVLRNGWGPHQAKHSGWEMPYRRVGPAIYSFAGRDDLRKRLASAGVGLGVSDEEGAVLLTELLGIVRSELGMCGELEERAS